MNSGSSLYSETEGSSRTIKYICSTSTGIDHLFGSFAKEPDLLAEIISHYCLFEFLSYFARCVGRVVVQINCSSGSSHFNRLHSSVRSRFSELLTYLTNWFGVTLVRYYGIESEKRIKLEELA